ncbi:MAG: energy transducer TonB [Acidobacteria bacterium]|nr:energy transducer TonB [Acidobacteriota bacterium]
MSFGVLNARAIELVKPDYPAAGKAMNVSGKVTIGIVIDPCGRVHEAKTVSGHPFLVSSSVIAALRSSFSPVTLSGKPIWVQGIIVYNFQPLRANWLQIGFMSDSAKMLDSYLPAGFERARTELGDMEGENAFLSVNPIVIELIRNKLSADQRSLWLFDTGRALKELSRDNSLSHRNRLLELIGSSPYDISPPLMKLLTPLAETADSKEFREGLSRIENRMYNLGL